MSSRSGEPRRFAECFRLSDRLRVVAVWPGIAGALLCLFGGAACAAGSPDAALARLLHDARAEADAPGACAQPAVAQPVVDRLVRIYCTQKIRVGVRDEYPLFATLQQGVRSGYEIDMVRTIAQRLGVAVEFINVKAATRIPMLADDSIDLVVATMGDHTQRETQARFIRPHYYLSQTVIVGPRDLAVTGWGDVHGLNVCVSVGNGSNAEMMSRHARLMLFDDAEALPDRLADQTCTLAAQDDSFFDYYFTDPGFAARFSVKFGLAQVPWGMGVALTGSDRLARALDLLSQIFHRDGVFLAAARANRIGDRFLLQQQAVWRRAECNTDTGSTNPHCVIPPTNATLQPTPFAAAVSAFEAWVGRLTGFDLELPMLKTAPAWSLFLDGIVNSLLLIVGVLVATLGFALLFGAAMGSRWRLLRWTARSMTIVLQSSPILLTLVIVAAIIRAFFTYSPTVALGSAIVALGLTNGSNAGQAIAEAYLSICAERAGSHAGRAELFVRALSRSATQIVAFLINAAKGTPIASFIGAPELLSVLTDISSFASGRATTYTLVLIFYTGIVIAVVWSCRRFQRFLERGRLLV
jgi:ABC-type amino acid transport substrate-binding protein/ABC-type amino acid transport system permease subunit